MTSTASINNHSTFKVVQYQVEFKSAKSNKQAFNDVFYQPALESIFWTHFNTCNKYKLYTSHNLYTTLAICKLYFGLFMHIYP